MIEEPPIICFLYSHTRIHQKLLLHDWKAPRRYFMMLWFQISSLFSHKLSLESYNPHLHQTPLEPCGGGGNWLALILTLLWISLLSISRWKKQNLVTFVSYCVPETTIPTGLRVKGSSTKYGLNSQSLLHLLQMLKFTVFIKKEGLFKRKAKWHGSLLLFILVWKKFYLHRNGMVDTYIVFIYMCIPMCIWVS